MADNLKNHTIKANQWVDLYSLAEIPVGEALSVENVGVCDIYLAVQETEPEADHNAYNVSLRANGVSMTNSSGDPGAWAFCPSDDGKISISRVGVEGFRPVVASTIYNPGGDPVTPSDPLPVSDYDNSHRSASNSIFGDRLVGTRIPTIAAQFQYGLRADDAVVDTVGSGSFVIEDAMLKLNTGTDANGHVGVQGADYIRYIPGHEAYAFFTCVFYPPVVDLVQRIGIFDFDDGNGNGFFIGYNGLVFGVTRRRAGVDTFTPVDISTIFPVDAGVYDPTLGNVYKISYGYLGFATIHFEILLPEGSFTELAEIQYPNTSTETHIANTNIPLRAEMTNTGNTIDSQMRIGSVSAGVVDGGGADPIARIFTQEIPTTTLGVGGNPVQLIHFRNKDTFFGISNKVTAQLVLISAATEGNKPVSWSIIKNADVTTEGTWADVSVDSVMEYSTDQVVDLNTGKLSLPWKMARSASFFEDVEKYLVKLRPGEWATIVAVSQTSNEVDLAVRWKELF